MASTSQASKFGAGAVVILIVALVYWFAGNSHPDAQQTAKPVTDVRPETAEDKRPVLLVVGDSLSAGYGLADKSAGWVALLQEKLDQEQLDLRVVNASISGDTSSGGAARLPAALDTHDPAIVVVELGGNDGLRGLPLPVMRQNFERMIVPAKARGASVVLLGMMIPPNYGERYTTDFQQQFVDLADDYSLTLVPFFLENVALSPSLMQGDGIHPNEKAQPVMLQNVWPALKPVINKYIESNLN